MAMESGHTNLQASTLPDGPVEGGLLPMVRINGILYVVPGCVHFFPNSAGRPGQQGEGE
jgi:hypothetical protein